MVSVDFDWANWKAQELDQFNTGLIGIDRIFDQFKQTQQQVVANSNYPPYNIVKVGKGDYKYVIEMAVAGHTMDSIDVTVEKQVLTVKGTGAAKADAEYIHKGDSTILFAEVIPRIFKEENNLDFISFNNTDLFVLHN